MSLNFFRLANSLRKDGKVIKINPSKFAVAHSENLNSFLKCLSETFKLSQANIFQSADLYENKNMAKVLSTLTELQKVAI